MNPMLRPDVWVDPILVSPPVVPYDNRDYDVSELNRYVQPSDAFTFLRLGGKTCGRIASGATPGVTQEYRDPFPIRQYAEPVRWGRASNVVDWCLFNGDWTRASFDIPIPTPSHQRKGRTNFNPYHIPAAIIIDGMAAWDAEWIEGEGDDVRYLTDFSNRW